MLFKNGTISGDLNYKDVCKEEHDIRIAYNNDLYWFEIDDITNTMVEYPHWEIMVSDHGTFSDQFEILKSFFANYNIKPTWINCNYTWGLFDDETGQWTGAVGQVKILTKKNNFAYFTH